MTLKKNCGCGLDYKWTRLDTFKSHKVLAEMVLAKTMSPGIKETKSVQNGEKPLCQQVARRKTSY